MAKTAPAVSDGVLVDKVSTELDKSAVSSARRLASSEGRRLDGRSCLDARGMGELVRRRGGGMSIGAVRTVCGRGHSACFLTDCSWLTGSCESWSSRLPQSANSLARHDNSGDGHAVRLASEQADRLSHECARRPSSRSLPCDLPVPPSRYWDQSRLSSVPRSCGRRSHLRCPSGGVDIGNVGIAGF